MTKKEVESKKKESTKKKAPEKLLLVDAVNASEYPSYIILGALSLAELLDQYLYEKKMYLKEEFKPSITMDELNKIIKDFLGE